MECMKCMCLTRDGVGDEWMRGLVLCFTNPVQRGGVLDVCVFGLRWCRWGVVVWPGSGMVGWSCL